jgi:hypothetical protein
MQRFKNTLSVCSMPAVLLALSPWAVPATAQIAGEVEGAAFDAEAQVTLVRSCNVAASGNTCIFDVLATANGSLSVCTTLPGRRRP